MAHEEDTSRPSEEAIAAASAEIRKQFEANFYPIIGVMALVGSTYYRGVGNDIDILVRTSSDPTALHFPGWEYGGSVGHFGDKWESWKRGRINMLVTRCGDYFERWCTAAEVCRYLVLKGYDLKTCDAHGIHGIIMDEAEAEDEVKRRNY